MSNDITDEVIEELMRGLIQTATKSDKFMNKEHINYEILKMLPTTFGQIKNATNLTKVPVYNHINELERYGLLRLQKGTGQIYPTDMTELFLEVTEQMKYVVKGNLHAHICGIVIK